jgi:hypothetical protein
MNEKTYMKIVVRKRTPQWVFDDAVAYAETIRPPEGTTRGRLHALYNSAGFLAVYWAWRGELSSGYEVAPDWYKRKSDQASAVDRRASIAELVGLIQATHPPVFTDKKPLPPPKNASDYRRKLSDYKRALARWETAQRAHEEASAFIARFSRDPDETLDVKDIFYARPSPGEESLDEVEANEKKELK